MTLTHKGLPGLAGTDHIGITVPDIDQAVEFFVNVIGCEEVYSIGPFRDDEGDWMEKHLNVNRRAVIPNIRMLRCKNGSNYELFEYVVEDQVTTPPANSDIGGHHVAFYVDDMEEAINHLQAYGVRVLGNPTTMDEGPSAGMTWVYFLAPWGMQMELVSYPQGQEYEKTIDAQLWQPKKPDEPMSKKHTKFMKNDAQKLQILWDKQEITEVMYRFARALDRVDAELMKACYWEDAIEEHQDPIFPEKFFWNDNAHKFVPIAMEGFKQLKATQHRISNPLIEIEGDTATAECYVWAYHLHEENGVDKEGILGGRHHYRFERRNDEWRIKHRSTVFDWNQNQNATAVWSENYSDKYKSKRDLSDDSYNYIQC